ncbi:MAG: D-tyrosyl-tRNA(Tyr) deacylase [Cognaticolwellia sp.]|jgi:D-tyrosyl-tRNA(Tyr) deacylase
MIALMQRVSEASVSVDNNVVGEIDQGLLVLLAIEPEDTKAKAERLAERVAGYRIFADENEKMNFNVKQIGGEILVVSQFTLAANTTKGMRPSFTSAAPAELSEALYQYFCTQLRSLGFRVPTGVFGANMQVRLLNDGPVTINLQG